MGGPAGAGVTNPPTTTSLHRTSDPRKILIQPTPIVVQHDGALTNITVSLVEERYLSESGDVRHRFYKYNLDTGLNEVGLSRVIWSPRHLGGFSLLSATTGQYYLFWLDGCLLCWCDVPGGGAKPAVQITQGITSCSQADHVLDLDVFAGSGQFWGTRADNCELGIVSAGMATNGVFSVTATNIFGKEFTFSNPAGEWRAFGESGELRRR